MERSMHAIRFPGESDEYRASPEFRPRGNVCPKPQSISERSFSVLSIDSANIFSASLHPAIRLIRKRR